MNKHLDILKQLYKWYWDSYINGESYDKWKYLSLSVKKSCYKEAIYNKLKCNE